MKFLNNSVIFKDIELKFGILTNFGPLNLKSHGKNKFMLKMYFYLFFEIKDSLLSVRHSEQSFLASDIFTIEFGRH